LRAKHGYILCLVVLLLHSCRSASRTERDVPSDVEVRTEKMQNIALVDLDQLRSVKILLDTNQHYRGLFVIQDTILVAGSSGHMAVGLIRSDGVDWARNFNVDSLHLRDLESINGRVHVLSIGSPGYLKEWHTTSNDSSGNLWKTNYYNTDTSVFMDGMDFWKNGAGLVHGDPLDGYHFILRTENAGRDWMRIGRDQLPEPIQDEAGFAASGTGVVCVGNGVGYIGWGGVKARVFKTTDYGVTWEVLETPVAHGKAGKGIYCMAWKNESEGVVAGGNWEDPTADSCYAFTKDGGETWTLGSGGSGYRSGICHAEDDIYFSVGTNGTDISVDGGATWKQIDKENMNAIQAAEGSRRVIAVGSHGTGFILKY